METLFHDIRYGLRQLRNNPTFTVVAVLTLGLGIGANTAIFSLVDQVLLRRLPVRNPEQLVMLRYSGADTGRVDSHGGDNHDYFSYPMYQALRDKNTVFSGLLASFPAQVGVQWHNQPDLAASELVSGNYFDVLGVRPAFGRLLVQTDDQTPGASPVAVLSFGYWQRRFGSDPRILNDPILINGHPFSVVGVAPLGFHSVVVGTAPDIFVPIMMKAEATPGLDNLKDKRWRWLNMIARLKPDVSEVQAEAGINPLWHSLRAEELKEIHSPSASFDDRFLNQSHLSLLDAAKGFSPVRQDMRTPLLIVMCMVGVLVLIACANVASLLLVRAAGRVREMCVRYALGAQQWRILRQLLVEGLLLGLGGGLLGAGMASYLSPLLLRMVWSDLQTDLPFSAHPDMRILTFNFALAFAVSVLFSLAPALQFLRPNLTSALKQQTVTTSGGAQRFRRVSVGVQIGLSLVLLVGAGLFARTLRNLKSVEVGFATDHLLTFGIDPRMAGYAPNQTHALYNRMLETLSGLPGVRSVGATDDPDLSNNNTRRNITIAGYADKEGEDMNVEWPTVSPGYLTTLEIPLLAGRVLTEQDGPAAGKVAVINESFAGHFFGGPQQALGHSFGRGGGNGVKTDIQIVGVVRDVKHTTVRDDVERSVFVPMLQAENPGSMSFYVRTWQTPETAMGTLRRAVQTLDPKLVLDSLRTMDDQINETLSTERIVATLAVGFGALAVLMAAVGLYGVLAFATAQRTREIGIRIALGADRIAVVRMIFTDVLRLAGISLAVALPLSLWLARFVRSLLFGVSSSDPLTLVCVTLLVGGVSVLAALLPARRAASVDPMVALRYE